MTNAICQQSPTILNLIFSLARLKSASLLIFDVSLHIQRRKQTFETSENSIFTQTKLDHFSTPLSTSFYPFSKNFMR